MERYPNARFGQCVPNLLDLAYADGPDTIPSDKRRYYDIPAEASLAENFCPGPLAVGICRDLSQSKSGVRATNSASAARHYPHLKLRVQRMELQQREVWVYSVDTHDRFHQATKHLSPEAAQAWRVLVEENSLLQAPHRRSARPTPAS